MRFEKINDIRVDDPENFYACHAFVIYREISTDVLWVGYNFNQLAMMVDPENGLPLTYTAWKEKYKDKN